MKFAPALFFLVLVVVFGAESFGESDSTDSRQRVVVLTDISNEPDDEESLVRFLVYSNEFDIEGLIATTSTHLRTATREDLIRRQIDAFAEVRDNLIIHAKGYPAADQLRAVTKTGQPKYGMAAVGDRKSSAGSRHLIKVIDERDERPVWVTVWGGANTLAQALWDVKQSRDDAAVAEFVSKLRVYTISDQDDAGPWIRAQFPSLFYIVSPGGDYGRATWNGIAGDRMRKTGVMHHFAMVDNPWLEENIIENHGPLGALYPRVEYIMEGDTPSFLGLINNGLAWHVRPDYGGWGGRYELAQPNGEPRPIWTDSADTVTSDDNGRSETSNGATIWRWREHFQSDFAARMDWCVADEFNKANHNPMAALNGDKTTSVIEIAAKPGDTVELTAEGSSDPDGDRIGYRWWIYEEASTLRDPDAKRFPDNVTFSSVEAPTTRLIAPQVSRPSTIHVILEVTDDGTPKLWSYGRAVVTVQP
ncbi:MAG: nucleoside hydrolase-like domain-containing protein [Pirellulales bacterium]